MSAALKKPKLAFLYAVCIILMIQYARTQTFGQAELVYEWKWLEIDWPTEADERNATNNGSFVPNRNLLSGVKVYDGQVYISVPRRRATNGQPISLAKVVNVGGRPKLRPYPDWAAQEEGNCQALQFVQSMEIDPNTGLMYVIDAGRVGLSLNLCPAKIVVYNLKTDRQVELHELPNDVVSNTSNFLNDIVLDYEDGKVKYAYMTDTIDASIVVYNFETRSAHKLKDQTMKTEGGNASLITINGQQYNFSIALNGIAMSPDFKYVYFCVLGGYNIYQVPTSTLRNLSSGGSSTGIRLVGKKVSQTDGMGHSSKNLYFGAIGSSAVYYWNISKDLADQKASVNNVSMVSQVELVRNDSRMQWPSTVAFDEQGWLWIACNRLQAFWNVQDPLDDGEPYMTIWKVYINEKGYLYGADTRTHQGNTDTSTQQGNTDTSTQQGNTDTSTQQGNSAQGVLSTSIMSVAGLVSYALSSIVTFWFAHFISSIP